MSTTPEGIRSMAKTYRDVENRQVADTLTEYAILRENLDRAPQIVRTPAELEALDPETVVLDRYDIYTVREYLEAERQDQKDYEHDLPAVVVASGEHVRACREALEGGAK